MVTSIFVLTPLPHRETQSEDTSDVAFFKAKLSSVDRSPAELLGSGQQMLGLQDTGQPPGLADYHHDPVPTAVSPSWSQLPDGGEEEGPRDPRPTSHLLPRPIEFIQEDSNSEPVSSPVDVTGVGLEEEEDRSIPESQLPQNRKTTPTTTVIYDKLEEEEEEDQISNSRRAFSAPSLATSTTSSRQEHRSRSSAQMKQAHSQNQSPPAKEGAVRPNLKELLLKYIEQKAARTLSETAASRAKSPPQLGSSAFAPPRSSESESEEEEEQVPSHLLQAQQQFFSPTLSPLPPAAVYQPPVVHRNLTSSSQRIAKNFQDLNAAESGGSRISRYNLPSSNKAGEGESGSASESNGKVQCGEAVTIDTNYELSSPNYPEKYPPNMDCSWEITATKQKVLRVQIFKLNIEQEQNCRFDYLDIIGEP